jgi:serine/threonine-protein kinase
MTGYLAGVQDRLHEAELSRAAESARAHEAEAKVSAERRARRLTAALAATVLVAGALGGAGWRWVELQRLERVRETSGRVNVALQEATRLRGQAQSAAVGEMGPWTLAAAAAEKARELLEPGIEPALRKQVENLAAERRTAEAAAQTARRDRTLLDRLVDIRGAEADDEGGWGTDAAYADAFREAGLDVAELSVEDAAKKIRARPPEVATALAVAVDDWAAIRRDRRKNRAGAASLSALARAADPDAWRNGLRDALDTSDKAARLAALRELARSAPYDTLGPVSMDLLGHALSAAGDPAAAETVLRRAQQRYADDVWINYDLAETLEKLARREEAIRYYTAARSLRPELAHELAHALERKGESDEGIAVFEDLRRLRPRDGRHLGCLGAALKARGRSQEAEAILEAAAAANREAVRLRPDDANAHYFLGITLREQGKLDEATAEYRTAIRIQPDLATTHFGLGAALDRRGKLDEAIAEYRTAIRLQPDDATAYNNLGVVFGQQGKLDEAIAEYRTAIRLQPDLANAHVNLGSTHQRQGKLDEAIAEYRTVIRIQPDNVTIRIYTLGARKSPIIPKIVFRGCSAG